MRKIGTVLLLPVSLFAQQLVYEFNVDTTQYESFSSYYAIQAPGIYNNGPISTLNAYVSTSNWTKVLKKKNSQQFDIYSFQGKIGSSIVPASITSSTFFHRITFSQTIVDNDLGWEYICEIHDTALPHTSFKVFDENGSVLLSDIGYAFYGYDGQNTYIFAEIDNGGRKIWKFRSNVSSQSSLPKTFIGSAPIMELIPQSGNFRVSLQPAPGGTSVQIFDMLGRQVFAKIIQNIASPTSFIIPSSNLPNSPFISRVSNSNGTFVKESIPVR